MKHLLLVLIVGISPRTAEAQPAPGGPPSVGWNFDSYANVTFVRTARTESLRRKVNAGNFLFKQECRPPRRLEQPRPGRTRQLRHGRCLPHGDGCARRISNRRARLTRDNLAQPTRPRAGTPAF